MQNQSLPRQVRSVLESLPDAIPLAELLSLVDDFVLDCSSSSEPDILLFELEEELHTIHHDVDHSLLFQTEAFLAILYHLGPVLPFTSVISWFDIVLRPALREPKLPTTAVTHAKELIISALQKTEETPMDKNREFRCRLLDLYLLDAFNEGSGNDVLEWAELEEEQREKRTCWKSNLEDILLKFGIVRPEDLMTEIYLHFVTPSARLQLLMLLNLFTSGTSFDASSAVLAVHPLMDSVLSSLLLDNSSTVCSAGLTLLIKLLPVLAVKARDHLKSMLPRLLAILARIMCWKERHPSRTHTTPDEPPDEEIDQELENEAGRNLPIRPDLKWERLELTFNATASLPPSPRPYFTTLYYLYPLNVLQFLRGPAQYLSNNMTSPHLLDWDQVLVEDEIRRKSESLLREHGCHPILIQHNATTELIETEFWAGYDISRITSEAVMLDIRTGSLGIHAQRSEITSPHKPPESSSTPAHDDGDSPAYLINPIHLSAGRASIDLQGMINTSVALKSKLDVEIIKPMSQWPHALFSSSTRSSSGGTTPSPPSVLSNDELPSHVTQAVSGLQREVLLLRNELNFELWLSRENIKHIGRLDQDRILAKSAEAERQGLYNKLRKYRAQVTSLEAELREHKQQASSAKNKYADWNTELQKKLRECREEKKSWIAEAATLRSAEMEAKALFAAQGKLLADATKKVFELQTSQKKTQHKIDRLGDYERQIDQHIQMQRLWDADFVKFNDRGEQMSLMQNQYKQMQMRLESYEKTQAEMEDSARAYRRQIQALEARLALANRQGNNNARQQHALDVAAFAAEKATLTKVNNRLKDENADLKDEVEEMKAMIEVLKGQHSGRKGLVSEPRASPLLYV